MPVVLFSIYSGVLMIFEMFLGLWNDTPAGASTGHGSGCESQFNYACSTGIFDTGNVFDLYEHTRGTPAAAEGTLSRGF
jgi:hypothetical protein